MALIPPFYLDCVVAIGTENIQGEKYWIASGFLYGHLIGKEVEGESQYRIYLVTNRHVLQGEGSFCVRFNPTAGTPAREYTLGFGKDSELIYTSPRDSDIDVAVINLDAEVLTRDGIAFSYFKSDVHVAGRRYVADLEILEGDFGYVLGFPMGMVGQERNFAIVRQGTIARIRDYLADKSKEILMDCMIFPGNSGGPVITRPEAVDLKGPKAESASYLIGLVKGYMPFCDVAISQQTNEPRVVFTENSGLASVIPIQYAMEIIEEFEANMKRILKPPVKHTTG
jgi:S1-C subfamily serine protease